MSIAVMLISSVMSFLLSMGLVAVVLRICRRHGWYDRVDARKVHTGNVPRLGGVGFAVAFIVIAAALTALDGAVLGSRSPGARFLYPLAALLVSLGFGAVDDFHPLNAKLKLFLHCVCAVGIVMPGYTFTRPFLVETGPLASLGWARYCLTFLWVIGMANAVNLIDGVDGVCGGISAIIAATYGAAFALLGDEGPGLAFCLCLTGALLGFLVFNAPLPRARIFMGDGGAYFLGFALALLPLVSGGGDGGGGVKTLPMFYAGALALIPVYDTAAAIWRRVRDHRPIDSPDRAHLHHKLMNLGLSARQIDLTLYGLQAVLSGLTLAALAVGGGAASLALLVSAYLLCLVFFTGVHYLNKRALARFSIPTPTDGARP